MIEFRPTEIPTTRPKVLLYDQWVKFSDKFPGGLNHVKGKYMRVAKQVQVTYPVTRIIKENCYVDIDLSNEDGAERLFPESTENLYEILIGLRPGHWWVMPYFPTDQPVYRLDYPTMTPLVSDAKLRYLGNIRPEDSPADDPVLRLYAMYKLKPVILRMVVDAGIDYAKCSLLFNINRCHMEEGTPPEGSRVKFIEYIDELKF